MLTHGNLHQFFTIFKVLETKSALFLINHVCMRFWIWLILKLDPFHYPKVHSNDRFRLMIDLIIVKRAVCSSSFITICQRMVSLFMFNPEETNYLDYYNDQEEKDGPRDEDHDASVRQILIVEIEHYCCCV